MLRGPRLLGRRYGEEDRDLLGRLADADRAGAAAAGTPGTPPARRADQPSRSRRAQLARGIPHRLSARGHPGLARSLLPRRRGHAHHRDRHAHADRLRRQLLRVHQGARRADGAAAPDEARPGRRDRADAGVHQPLPLPGDQGVAGAEPDQDDGQDRPHRDPAGAQARALPFSADAEERADGDGAEARAQGLRRDAGLRRRQPAHRARATASR